MVWRGALWWCDEWCGGVMDGVVWCDEWCGGVMDGVA